MNINDTTSTKINDVDIDQLVDVLKRREGWIPGAEENGQPSDPCVEPPPRPQPITPITDIKKKVAKATITRSPIALDLNGDGITTTGLQDGAYFDHDGNGFAEQTGRVNSQDGILVRTDGVTHRCTQMHTDAHRCTQMHTDAHRCTQMHTTDAHHRCTPQMGSHHRWGHTDGARPYI